MYQEESTSYSSISPIKTVKNPKIKITKVIKKNFNLSVAQPRSTMRRVRPVLSRDVPPKVGSKTKYYGMFLDSTKETGTSKSVQIFSPTRENNMFYLEGKEQQADSSPQSQWPVIDITSSLSSSKEPMHWTYNTSKYFPWYSSGVKDRPVSTDHPSPQPGEHLAEKRQTWYKLPNEYQEPTVPTVSSTTSPTECNSSSPRPDLEVTNKQHSSSPTENNRPKVCAPGTLPSHAELRDYGIFFEDERWDDNIGDTRGEEVCFDLQEEQDKLTEMNYRDVEVEPSDADPESLSAWTRLEDILPYVSVPIDDAAVRKEMENNCSNESESLIRRPSDSLTDKPSLTDHAFPSGVFAENFGIHMEDDGESNDLSSTGATNQDDATGSQPSTERPDSPDIQIIKEIRKADLSNSSRELREKYMKCILKRNLENSKTLVGTPVYFFCCLRCFVCIKWKNVESDRQIMSCPFCSKRRKLSS